MGSHARNDLNKHKLNGVPHTPKSDADIIRYFGGVKFFALCSACCIRVAYYFWFQSFLFFCNHAIIRYIKYTDLSKKYNFLCRHIWIKISLSLDHLFILLKFLSREYSFGIWEQKSVTRGQIKKMRCLQFEAQYM